MGCGGVYDCKKCKNTMECHVVTAEIWFDTQLRVSHHIAQFKACSIETGQAESMMVVSSEVAREDMQIARFEHECAGPLFECIVLHLWVVII